MSVPQAEERRRRSIASVPMLAELAAEIDRSKTMLDAGPWAELAASARPARVQAGEWLFRQGDPGDSLYVVLTGRLEVVIEEGDEQKVIRVLGRGGSVGEVALLTESPRSASVRARRDSELLHVTREHFARLAAEERVSLVDRNQGEAHQLGDRRRRDLPGDQRPHLFQAAELAPPFDCVEGGDHAVSVATAAGAGAGALSPPSRPIAPIAIAAASAAAVRNV